MAAGLIAAITMPMSPPSDVPTTTTRLNPRDSNSDQMSRT